MYNSKKINNIILIILLFLLLLPIKSLGIVSPTKEFFVNDYADVLSEETKDYIIQANKELQQKTGAQIVVVTLKSLEGKSIEEYATDLFRSFGIGDSEKNNGVLLLCSTGDRLFRIEVGYGLEGTLTDGKTGRIQDEYIIPYLRNNKYNDGIKNGFSAILQEVSSEYGISITSQETAQKTQNSSNIDEEMYRELAYGTTIIITIGSSLIIGNLIHGRDIKYKSIFFVIYACFLLWYIHNNSYGTNGIELITFVQRVIILLFNSIILLIYCLLKPRKKGKSNFWFSNHHYWSGGLFGGGSSSRGSSGGGGSTRSF